MTDAHVWIRGRSPAPPGPLREAIVAALHRAPSEGADVPGTMAAAALVTLEVVLAGSGERGSAAQLLAADALLTYACEAAAEAGPGALTALVDALRPEAFEALAEGRG